QVPANHADLQQVMFKKGLTSKDGGGATFLRRPRRKPLDGSAKREQRRQLRKLKRQHKSR
ncbi:unnamed protein product, partial [Choristocarpus tenellus]